MLIDDFSIDGKKICVIDDFFAVKADIDRLYLSVATLPYKIDGRNFSDIQNRQTLRLTATIDNDFANSINLFSPEREEVLNKYIPSNEYFLHEAYCNLGLVSDYQEPHVDNYDRSGSITLLIYCNRTWENNWGGETFFYSDDGKKVVYTSKNTPGRAIIFDGSIPHMAGAQSSFADQYRFTIAVKFVKRDSSKKVNTSYL